MAFRNQPHLIVGMAVFLGAVGFDVPLHIGVGQAAIAFLAGILFDAAALHPIFRIVQTHLLKVGVFGAHGVLGILGKGTVHYDGAVNMVDLKDVLHNRILLKMPS